MKTALKGKRVKRRLNNHTITVILPGKKISYEEGMKKMREIADKINNKN